MDGVRVAEPSSTRAASRQHLTQSRKDSVGRNKRSAVPALAWRNEALPELRCACSGLLLAAWREYLTEDGA